MEINEHIIKFSGELSIEGALENGADYMLGIEGGVDGITEKPNHDGTAKAVYKFRPTLLHITTPKGKTVKSLDKKRNSQKLRNMINYYRQNNFPEFDEEDFYNRFIGKLMANFEYVAEYLKNLK